MENYCPVCGDVTITPTDNHETNTSRFVKSPEYRAVFECFLRLFEIKDPLLWFDKAFVFCSECARMMTVVSELEQVLKEVERRLKESEKLVQEKFKSSEGNFWTNRVYGKDGRYWKVRGGYLNKAGRLSTGTGLPEGSHSKLGTSATSSSFFTINSTSVKPRPIDGHGHLKQGVGGGEVEYVNVDVDLSKLDDGDSPSRPREETLTASVIANYEDGQDKDEVMDVLSASMNLVQTQDEEANHSRKRQRSQTPAQQLKCQEGKRRRKASDSEGDTEDVVQLTFETELNLDTFFQEESESLAKEGLVAATTEEENGRCNAIPTQSPEADPYKKPKPESELTPEEEKQKALAIARWLTPGRPEVFHYGIRLFKIGDGKQYQCSACDVILPIRSRNSEKNVLHHVVQYHTDVNKCGECGDRFPTRPLLHKHEDIIHKGLPKPPPPEKKNKCPICEKPLNDIRAHVFTHYSKTERAQALARGEKPQIGYLNRYKCDECGKRFQCRKLLQNHQKRIHDPNIIKSKITEVDKTTISIYDVLLTKIEAENGDDDDKEHYYKCSKCDKETILKRSEVSKHVVKEHTSLHKCEQCGKRFHKKYLLQIHLKSSHKLGDQNFCPICRHPFYGKKPPRRHIWTHFSESERQEALARGEKVPHGVFKKYQCEKCPASFYTNGELVKHQDQIHEKKNLGKRKDCEVCGASVRHLAAHMRAIHPRKEDYRFVCTVCNRRFTQHAWLKGHKLHCHVVGMKFKCRLCGREFKLEKQLEEHRKGVHLNIRPHQCVQCPMAFARREILRRHIEGVHEGKKFKQYPRRKPRSSQKKWGVVVAPVEDIIGGGVIEEEEPGSEPQLFVYVKY